MKYKKEIEHIAVAQGGMQKIQFRVFSHHFDMNSLQPKVKWTGVTVEGGDEMKALYHVIFFNKKTEEIHFKSYIAAKDERDATMLAVQNYGSYNSNEHIVIVKEIADSQYEPIK